MNATTDRKWTIEGIKAKSKAEGSHFFDAGAMRFFASRILSTVYQGPGGVFFVTSEQFIPSQGFPDPRRYTVRTFNLETGFVDTAGPFNKLSKAQAIKRAKGYAAGTLPVPSE